MARGFVEAKLFETGEAADRAPRAPAGASKTFRGYDPHQVFLLLPSLDDWQPEDHTARFIAEAVEEPLDLSEIYAPYESAAGARPTTRV